MGILDSFTARAAEVWRKYVTDGVPASGLHSPDLDQIARWGLDVETALVAIGQPGTRTVLADAEAVFAETEEMLIVDKTVAGPTSVVIPDATTRVLDVIIKDGKGDASANAITPAFTGGQTCDGLTGSNLQITTNFGMLWMRRKPDGSGYVMMSSQL